jgi:3-methyl-2-oxobutanoate hydroxymethyltransferase
VTKSLKIPTIGIGAGPHCDGQILVLHDLLGFEAGFKPKFLKKFADLGAQVIKALHDYDLEVKSGQFPTPEHSFSDPK